MSKVTEVAQAIHEVRKKAMLDESNGMRMPRIAVYADVEFYHDMRGEAPSSGAVSSTIHEFVIRGTIFDCPVFPVLPYFDTREGSERRAKPYHVAIVGWASS